MHIAIAKFLLALAGHTVLWVMVVNRSHAYGWPRKWVDYLTLFCGGMLLMGAWMIAAISFSTYVPWPAWLSCVLPVTYTWLSQAVAITAVLHATWRWLLPERRGGTVSRRESPIDMQGATADDLLAAGLPRLLGRLPGNQVVAPLLVETELAVPDLPPAFDGLRISHLTDLHMSGRIEQRYYDRIVEQSNKLKPDIVAITGDIVEREHCMSWVGETLAKLEARYAKLFVLGNHDTKANPDEIRRQMVAADFSDVGGKAELLEWDLGSRGEQKCLVAGNEMPWFGPTPDVSPFPSRTMAPDVLRLALLHTPDHFAWTQQQGFHVALAGHNHGGQIRFPLLGALVAPSKYGTRYDAGVFQNGGTAMNLSQGTSSLTPLRYLCPPELSLLTLRRV